MAVNCFFLNMVLFFIQKLVVAAAEGCSIYFPRKIRLVTYQPCRSRA
ncbi:hypothetical protein [Chitinophaga sp.]